MPASSLFSFSLSSFSLFSLSLFSNLPVQAPSLELHARLDGHEHAAAAAAAVVGGSARHGLQRQSAAPAADAE